VEVLQKSFLIAIALCVCLTVGCTNPAERAAKYLANAQTLFDKGDLKKADIEARNAAQIEPKNAKARYLLALIAEKQQDWKQMGSNLTVAVDSDPKFVAARTKLGTLYFLGQAYKLAAEQAKAAMALAPNDPAVRVLNARVLLQQGQNDEGMKELDVALAKEPGNLEALLLKAVAMAKASPDAAIRVLDDAILKAKGEDAKTLREVRISILAQQQRLPEVEEAFRSLVRDFPKDERLQFQLARFYAGQGRVDDAEKVMRAVVDLDPTDATARLGLVQFLAEMRSPDAAEKALESFVSQTPDSMQLRLALSRMYEANKKPDAALSAYQELVKKGPKSPEATEARVRIGAIQIIKGKRAEGQAEIDKVLVDVPDQPEALLIRAGLRLADKKYNDAVADIRTVIRKEPNNKRAILTLARTYAMKGDRGLAKDSYRQLLALDPSNADAPRELALVEQSEGNMKGAQEILRKRIEVDTKDIDARVRLFNLRLQDKDFAGAEDDAKEISRLDDQRGVGDLQLARALAAQKKYPQAVDAFKRALEKSPDWVLALEGVIAIQLQMDKKDDALAFIQGYLQKHPTNTAAKLLAGSVRKARGENAEAEKLFEAVVAEQPGAIAGWTALASLHPTDLQKRTDILKRGIKAGGDNMQLVMLLGAEYEQAGRWDDAIANYDESIKVNPNYELVANNLAALLLDRRTDSASHARALALAKPFEKSTNPGLMDTLGWAYYRTGDYPNAVVYLEKTVAAAGEVPMLRYHLGMAYAALKKNDKAKAELTKAVESKNPYPGLEEARAALKRLGGAG
jgi:tetratricopeptide (TPR) repeat protein